MPGGNPTQQAQQNQQAAQAQGEAYLTQMINQMTGNLTNYLHGHPSPASRWAAINNPARQTGTFGGGQAGATPIVGGGVAQGRPSFGGGEAQARPTVGSAQVPGGAPWNPPQTALARALIGARPRSGGKG